jgi:hypothetical protein
MASRGSCYPILATMRLWCPEGAQMGHPAIGKGLSEVRLRLEISGAGRKKNAPSVGYPAS